MEASTKRLLHLKFFHHILFVKRRFKSPVKVVVRSEPGCLTKTELLCSISKVKNQIQSATRRHRWSHGIISVCVSCLGSCLQNIGEWNVSAPTPRLLPTREGKKWDYYSSLSENPPAPHRIEDRFSKARYDISPHQQDFAYI